MRDVFLETLERLLEPLVRYAVRRSIRIQSFQDCAKRVYCRIAEEEILRMGESVNPSKVSAVTGLQRKDIKRLAESAPDDDRPEDLLTRVVGRWQSDRRFKTEKGTARALSLGGMGEFAELVHSVSKDLNPYTVLFELERAGVVRSEDKTVELTRNAYQPRGDVKQALGLLAADARDLFEAVEENAFSRAAEPNLHIKTEYDNIPISKGPHIRDWFLREGEKFHERARKFLSQFDRDLNPDLKNDRGPRIRAMVGMFSFTQTVEARKKEVSRSQRKRKE